MSRRWEDVVAEVRAGYESGQLNLGQAYWELAGAGREFGGITERDAEMFLFATGTTERVLVEAFTALLNRRAEVGREEHPDGTGGPVMRSDAERFAVARDYTGRLGVLDWRSILLAEVYAAMAEDGPEALRERLLQVIALSVAWVEDIGHRERAR